jgi:hypothetical protein
MADKQTVLADAIAVRCHKELTPEMAKIGEQLAKLAVSNNAIIARLETLEGAVSSGGAASKRAVRTGAGAAAKPAGAKKAGKKAADDPSKVTNALLFCRWELEHDLNDAREAYGTEENLLKVSGEKTVSTREADKDKSDAALGEYWSAVGNALWKSVLTEGDKKEIRGRYATWKEELARESAAPALDEDAADDAAADE